MRHKLIITASLVLVLIVGGAVFVSNRKQQLIPVTYTGSYIAFGDSVAAGIGLKDYADASACDRTTAAYPRVIARHFTYRLSSYACSNAQTSAGLLGPQIVNQLSIRPQINSLPDAKPRLITMTIGINDTGWSSYLTRCYTTVCGTATDTANVRTSIDQVTNNLDSTLTQINAKYPNNPPPVVITGYYRLFPAELTTGCVDQTGIDASELNWINQLTDELSSHLETVAASQSFSHFARINFANHELCSSDSWIQGLGANAPYHPTAAGQAAIAKQIIRVLQ